MADAPACLACEHTFVTSDGHAYTRFRRALLTKNPGIILPAAADMLDVRQRVLGGDRVRELAHDLSLDLELKVLEPEPGDSPCGWHTEGAASR
jgi:hypothetical protein